MIGMAVLLFSFIGIIALIMIWKKRPAAASEHEEIDPQEPTRTDESMTQG